MAETEAAVGALQPLKIKCTSTDCDNGLHCFLKSRKQAANRAGHCRACGINLVDWKRVHQCDLGDAEYTFTAMKYEMIRHHFWHTEIDQKAINYALRKGIAGMRVAAENRIRKSVGPEQPARDGRQTGWAGNPIFYAQHATATCCRRCIEEWHGIPRGRALDEAQIGYFADLVMLYVQERLPFLTVEGTKVPPIRADAAFAQAAAA